MASLETVESSYYSAIKTAKLTDTDVPGELVLPYSKDQFQHWVKRLDIYDLDKYKADFFLDQDTVTQFTYYRKKVVDELPKHTEYEGIKVTGQVKNIGSCQDGSKVGKMNETDSLYVLDTDNFKIETNKGGSYRILGKQKNMTFEINPRSIRKQFADGYAEVISKLPLPEYLRHAGYKSPAYSGLRYNGPAATSQFLTKGNSLLTWDMTPAFCLCTDDMTEEVRRTIEPALKINSKTMFADMDIHLIPDANEGCWRLSTAQLEADLLRELIPPVAPMRQSLSNSKVLASQMKKWNAKNLPSPVCLASGLDIVRELDVYLESGEKELGERLDQILRYAHIWIPPEKRSRYHEDEKAYVSINTAAIKHILLVAALENPKAFAGEKDEDLVLELMILVFKTLGDPTLFSSPHAFLKGSSIPHISVLSSQAENKRALALGLKEQCRMLVSGAMTKVSTTFFVE